MMALLFGATRPVLAFARPFLPPKKANLHINPYAGKMGPNGSEERFVSRASRPMSPGKLARVVALALGLMLSPVAPRVARGDAPVRGECVHGNILRGV
jgi:hypothetical protein